MAAVDQPLPRRSWWDSPRRWLATVGPLTTGAIVCVWVWLAVRVIPTPYSDYGVFLAVAERLRAGERLYAQVWDNKDPLVYLSIAGARLAGVAGLWLLELVWLAAGALAVYAISRAYGLSIRYAALVGLVVTPVMMLGPFYFMGTTHLPGVALTLVALALASRGSPRWAGAALGVLALFKVIMVPLAVALVIVVDVRRRQGATLVATAVTAAVATAAGLILLLVRGELVAYVGSLLLNVGYSQTPTTETAAGGLRAWVDQHTAAVADARVILMVAVTVVLLAIAWRLRRRLQPGPTSDDVTTLVMLVVVALAVEVATLLAVGKFTHHAEILLVSSALGILLVVRLVGASGRRGTLVTVSVVAVTAFLAAGAPSPVPFWQAVINARVTWGSTAAEDPVTRLLTSFAPTAFAMVGQGNVLPRSPGLEGWTLGCPRIAQRPFDPASSFDENVECIARTPIVIVAPDAVQVPGFPAWNAYLAAVRDTLARDFTCRKQGELTVCERTTSA